VNQKFLGFSGSVCFLGHGVVGGCQGAWGGGFAIAIVGCSVFV